MCGDPAVQSLTATSVRRSLVLAGLAEIGRVGGVVGTELALRRMGGDPLVVGTDPARDRLCLTLRPIADVRARIGRPRVRVVDAGVLLGPAVRASWIGHEAYSFSMHRSLRTGRFAASSCSCCWCFGWSGRAVRGATAPLQRP